MENLLKTVDEQLSNGYILRPVTWEDLEPITDMLNAWSMHHLGTRKFDVDESRREWQTPGFSLQESTRIAVAPSGEIAAYYEVWDLNNPPVRINLWGRVHPQHTGRGLGTHLMAWAIERARQAVDRSPVDARVSLGTSTLSSQSEALRFFEANGFVNIRHYLRMVIDLDGEPLKAEWPAGITVRSMVRGQDERAVVQAFRDSFQDHWGYVETPFEETYERWMSFIAGNPHFDPDLWYIAENEGQVAGFSNCWKMLPGEPELGWVGTLGVLRHWRRRGLGLALLRHSFAGLYQRGQRKIGLGVDASNLTGATRLYEKAGMRSDPQHQISFYERELRPGKDLSTQSLEA